MHTFLGFVLHWFKLVFWWPYGHNLNAKEAIKNIKDELYGEKPPNLDLIRFYIGQVKSADVSCLPVVLDLLALSDNPNCVDLGLQYDSKRATERAELLKGMATWLLSNTRHFDLLERATGQLSTAYRLYSQAGTLTPELKAEFIELFERSVPSSMVQLILTELHAAGRGRK